MIRLEPLGDRAWLARFDETDEASRWAAALREALPRGVADVVLAYADVAVFADPATSDLDALERVLHLMEPGTRPVPEPRLHTIPVLYDGQDLDDVASRLSVSVDEVIAIHSQTTYRIQAMGFSPGFPYAGDLDPRLRGLPRRASPRARVPAGSVAMVGHQTAIYPTASPGGWHLLGRTPWKIADPEANLFPMSAGDLLRFRAIGEEEYRDRLGESLR